MTDGERERVRTLDRRVEQLEARVEGNIGDPSRSVEELDDELWTLATTLSSLLARVDGEE